MPNESTRVIRLIGCVVFTSLVLSAAAHEDPPPRVPGPMNITMQVMTRSKLAESLTLTLLTENYTPDADLRRRITELSQAKPWLGTNETQQAALLREFDEKLDALVRFDETTELILDDKGLRLSTPPRKLRLVADVPRLVPVILVNRLDRNAMLGWEASGTGQTPAAPRGTTRFFIPIEAKAGAMQVPIRLKVGDQMVEVNAPLELTPSGRVHVTVVTDSAEPTPVRLYVTGAGGGFYPPFGATKRIGTMGDRYTHIPGRFSLTLPVGPATVEAAKGFEYAIGTLKLNVAAGDNPDVRLAMRRIADLPAEGWYSGDGHIHMSYGGTLPIRPEDAILMLQAEDLNAGNMVVANIWGDDIQDQQHFSGELHRLSLPRYHMRWNEEYRNNFWGHLILYGLKKLSDPIYSGFANTPHPFDFPLNIDIAEQTLSQGGFVTGAHPFFDRNEHAADVVLGKMGGIETMGYGAQWSSGIAVLHALWNCGLRPAATAGTDSFLNMVQNDPLGGARCYAKVDGEFSYDAWVDAMRHGRTFVTTGPLLWLEINNQGPGQTLKAEGSATVRLKARALSQWPLTDLKIFHNGRVIHEEKAGDNATNELRVDREIQLDASGWVAAQATGPHNRFIFGGGLFRNHPQVAHTSPVWVELAGRPIPPTPDAARFVAWMDKLAQEARTRARFKDDQQRDYALDVLARARARFQELADRK